MLHVVRSAVFWDSVPDLSVLWGREVFWVLRFFRLNLVAIVTSVEILMASAAVQSEQRQRRPIQLSNSSKMSYSTA